LQHARVRRCRDRITLAVLELLESGELAKLKTKWWLEKGKCDKEGSPKKVLTVFYNPVRTFARMSSRFIVGERSTGSTPIT